MPPRREPFVDLPVMPPVKPMLAKAITPQRAWDLDYVVFEPKWDGFR